MADILQDLEDLHKQATTERSHYYTAECVRMAIAEIKALRHQVNPAQPARQQGN